jgi:hypothetical protein
MILLAITVPFRERAEWGETDCVPLAWRGGIWLLFFFSIGLFSDSPVIENSSNTHANDKLPVFSSLLSHVDQVITGGI